MATPTPGVDRQPHATLHRTGSLVAARMPVLLPAHELVGDPQFVPIEFGAGPRDVEVFHHEVKGIHVQFCGRILYGAHGDETRLWMVRSTPCAARTYIRQHRRVLL